MEKKIEECSLAIISKLPQICKPNEFMVAYFIITTMAVKKNDRVKIYRGQLADQCNMTERNISRISERLNEIGIIRKTLIGDAEKKKTFNYYYLNWQFIEEFLARFDNEESTFLPELSGLKNKRIEEIKNKRNKDIKKNDEIDEIKEIEIEEKKKDFETVCGIEEEMETELNEVGISDENDFNWKDEIIRFQAKVGRTNTKEELLNISRDFNQKMNDFNYPRELEKELETIKKVVNSKMFSLSM